MPSASCHGSSFCISLSCCCLFRLHVSCSVHVASRFVLSCNQRLVMGLRYAPLSCCCLARLHVSCSVHVASLFVMHRSHVVVPRCPLCIALMLLPSVCISPGVRSCMSHACARARASQSAMKEGGAHREDGPKKVRPTLLSVAQRYFRCTLCRYAVFV